MAKRKPDTVTFTVKLHWSWWIDSLEACEVPDNMQRAYGIEEAWLTADASELTWILDKFDIMNSKLYEAANDGDEDEMRKILKGRIPAVLRRAYERWAKSPELPDNYSASSNEYRMTGKPYRY